MTIQNISTTVEGAEYSAEYWVEPHSSNERLRSVWLSFDGHYQGVAIGHKQDPETAAMLLLVQMVKIHARR